MDKQYDWGNPEGISELRKKWFGWDYGKPEPELTEKDKEAREEYAESRKQQEAKIRQTFDKTSKLIQKSINDVNEIGKQAYQEYNKIKNNEKTQL